MRPANAQQISKIKKAIARYFTSNDIRVSIDNGYEFITIYPETTKRPDLAGLQMTWFLNDNVFEFSEYMAGENENELHIFSINKSLNACLRSFLKGKRTPIKIYQ